MWSPPPPKAKQEAITEELFAMNDAMSFSSDGEDVDDDERTTGSGGCSEKATLEVLQERVSALLAQMKEKGVAATDPIDAVTGMENAVASRKGKGAKEKRTMRGNTKVSST